MESENQTVCRGRNLCAVWFSFLYGSWWKRKDIKKEICNSFCVL